jgi:ATP-binding cassette subfamily C protein LapB
MKQAGDRQSVLVESVLNLELLKAHNAEGYLQKRWETANLAAADSYKKTRAITNFMLGLTASTQQLVTVVMVVFGVYLIADNALTLGGLIASVILAGRAIAPLSNIMSLASRYQQARSALETLDGLMQRPSDHDVTRQHVQHEEFTGRLVAQNVEFTYPGEHRIPVVRGISMTIGQGERIGLLGKVGSGKSTLLRLLSGLYTPTNGTVTVDDVDLRQIDPYALRKHIGYVGQDPQLFRGTLRENLRLSDNSISDRTIIETLKRLDLHTIVESHPLGLNMQLTEAGGGLSGGQRQLVAIARMMLRNPIYVFMDEPTANMDQVTEARVIDVLSEWLKGRTLLLATHRLQLLFWVQRVAVIEKGICLADGPRDEVMREIARGAQVAKSLSDLGKNPGVAG